MTKDSPTESPVSGGSGGGPLTNDNTLLLDGMYSVTANQVELVSRPPMPPAVPSDNVITILAAGYGVDGLVNVRGSKGVRVTSGPPPLPETKSSDTNGVEVIVGETGTLSLQRGLIPEVDQKMEMTTEGITIDGGVGKVTIKSMTEIELSVCEGIAKITLGPEGVTIQALTINLSAQVQAQIQGLMAQMMGSAMAQISGGITMIG